MKQVVDVAAANWPQSLRAAHDLLTRLVDSGLRELVLSPGSRSAPLAYAGYELAQAGALRLHVRLDERSAGFWALGLAKGWLHQDEDDPDLRVAVATTSGTAVANLLPACLEASHSQIPLLLLTADRPAALRGTGANQTTWQAGMFQNLRAGWDVDGDALTAARADELAVAATAEATGIYPGPVQINLCLTEPLAPLAPGEVAAAAPSSSGSLRDWRISGVDALKVAPLVKERALPAGVRTKLASAPRGGRGVVVAGDQAGARAAELALACGYPLLAEPSSQARWGNAVEDYVGKLNTPLARQIDEVVVFGHPTLSRGVSALLARRDIPITVLTQGYDWTDVAGAATCIADEIEVPTSPVAAKTWLESWQGSTKRRDSWPMRVVEIVTAATQDAGLPLLLGSSQVIRRADRVAPCPPRPVDAPVFASRGLAGIDGSIATAQGLSLALGRPTRALLGDLTFWHDIGSLNSGKLEPAADVQVIVINDGGGRIFAKLEHGAPHLKEQFERLFATPQGGSISGVAAGFGVPTTRIEEGDEAGLHAALAQQITGLSVLEIVSAGN